jgi:hypothetical protein
MLAAAARMVAAQTVGAAPGENFAVSEIESGQQARNELAACG